MAMTVAKILAPMALLAITGCADAWEPSVKTTTLQSEALHSNTASLTHTFVRDGKSTLFTCTQPAPDAAFDQGEAADLSITLVSLGGEDSGGEEENSAEAEMAGRTPTVLMTRELFFRACEFSNNYKLTKAEALELYNKTLEKVTEVWATEAGNTTVTIGDTISDTTTTGVTSSATGSITQTETTTDEDSDTESTTTDDSN